MNAPFDRALVRRHRARAALAFAAHDFLRREVADAIADRLGGINRRFETVIALGGLDGAVAEPAQMIQTDFAQPMLARRPGPRIVADEEALPLKTGSIDLVLSALVL